jgi:hypothetical protein
VLDPAVADGAGERDCLTEHRFGRPELTGPEQRGAEFGQQPQPLLVALGQQRRGASGQTGGASDPGFRSDTGRGAR